MFLFLPVFAFAAAGDVVINEIGAYEAASLDREWIEIYNRSAAPVDLAGWKFVEDFSDSKPNGVNHCLSLTLATTSCPAKSIVINPEQYVIIAQNKEEFKKKYPTYSDVLIIDSSWESLNDSGEKIGLKDANEDFSELFTYIEAKKYSLERKDFNLNDYTSVNWQEHQSGSTPGVQNSNYSNGGGNQNNSQNPDSQNDNQSPQDENIIANNPAPDQTLIADAGQNIAGIAGAEIVFDGSKSVNPSSGEMSYLWNFGNGETAAGKIAEYSYKYPGRYIASLTVSSGSAQANAQIEVYVYSAGIYISEFIPSPVGSDEENEWIEIANNSDSIADISDFQLGDGSSVIFKIPKNTYIASRSFLVFARSATKISLNNDEDKIVLYYPSGEITDNVEYNGGVKEGFSAGRTSDGRFLWTKNLTPGTANIFLNENNGKTSSAPAQKIVSENKNVGFRAIFSSRFSVVGGQSNGDLISFLPEVSAKTVDGYDDPFDSAQGKSDLADARLPEDGVKTNQAASLIDSLKNNIAVALILIPSIILSALVLVFRRKFWK